ncbi:hypothetical protein Tco_0056005, partial [Tanacetum coccineum]
MDGICRFLNQKAKIEWLRVGDSNSAYFHKAVKGRVSRSRINVVSDSNDVLFYVDQVPMAFVNHYAAFLGQHGVTSNLNTHNLFTKKLDSNVLMDTRLLSLKKLWDVVANDVTRAVQEFFTNSKLLKELNHTIIALIPK